MKITLLFLFIFYSFYEGASFAGEVDVIDVKLSIIGAKNSAGDQKYRIDVTLKHGDTGWDHYANAWQVFDEKGDMIGERVLYHPHVEEQPFTRSLVLTISKDVKAIVIKGQDSVHGLGGVEKVVQLYE